MPKIILFIIALLIMSVNTYDCVQLDDGSLSGPKCQAEGGQCTDIFSGLVDRPVCVLLKGCKYSFQRKGCVDFQNICQKGKGCCQAVAQSAKDGRPICKCIQSLSETTKCPKCLDWFNNGQCFDQDNLCSERERCCDLQKWGAPADSLIKYWPVCDCRKSLATDTKCKTCVFNKVTASCDDVNNQCKSKGTGTAGNNYCCQIKPNSFSMITGLPTCECVKKDKCPNCKRTSLTSTTCSDPTQNCQAQPGQCCTLETYFNGVQYCNCKGCPVSTTCAYNKVLKQCKGACGTGNCCQPTGKLVAPGVPGCVCAKTPLTVQTCPSCQWSPAGKCRDVTGKCEIAGNKCCKLDAAGLLCQCQECQSEQKCKFNPTTKRCQKNGCTNQCSQNIFDAAGVPICKCLQILADNPVFVESVEIAAPANNLGP